MATMKPDTIKALLLCAGKNDTRFYLNGVLFSENKQGHMLALATDGMRMLAVTDETQAWPHGQIIIPRAALETASKAKDLVTVHADRLELPGGVTVPYVPVDGRFPDVSMLWAQAFYKREKTDAEPEYPAAFDAALIADFAKCAKLLSESRHTAIRIYADDPTRAARVEFTHASALGAVMPYRARVNESLTPEMFTPASVKPEAVAA